MQQAALFLKGERDYLRIEGDTGPCVYPAAHLYIYAALYKLTDNGKDIFLGKCIFAALYMIILATVMACYRKARVRPRTCNTPFTPVLVAYIGAGSTIHLLLTQPIIAHAQPLYAEVLQRRPCGGIPVLGHIRVPEPHLVCWQHRIFLGCRDQDDDDAGCSWDRHDTATSSTHATADHGTGDDGSGSGKHI